LADGLPAQRQPGAGFEGGERRRRFGLAWEIIERKKVFVDKAALRSFFPPLAPHSKTLRTFLPLGLLAPAPPLPGVYSPAPIPLPFRRAQIK